MNLHTALMISAGLLTACSEADPVDSVYLPGTDAMPEGDALQPVDATSDDDDAVGSDDEIPAEPREYCLDTVDNDGDGAWDCDDSACVDQPECTGDDPAMIAALTGFAGTAKVIVGESLLGTEATGVFDATTGAALCVNEWVLASRAVSERCVDCLFAFEVSLTEGEVKLPCEQVEAPMEDGGSFTYGFVEEPAYGPGYGVMMYLDTTGWVPFANAHFDGENLMYNVFYAEVWY